MDLEAQTPGIAGNNQRTLADRCGVDTLAEPLERTNFADT